MANKPDPTRAALRTLVMPDNWYDPIILVAGLLLSLMALTAFADGLSRRLSWYDPISPGGDRAMNLLLAAVCAALAALAFGVL